MNIMKCNYPVIDNIADKYDNSYLSGVFAGDTLSKDIVNHKTLMNTYDINKIY